MSRQERILVIDDNPENCRLVFKILTKSGYECLAAGDAYKGMEEIEKQAPDLLLLDMSLPGLDGWEFAKRLKSDPKFQSIPIVALTAHAMKYDEKRALDAGCDAYMAKPFRSAGLLEMVRGLLDA